MLPETILLSLLACTAQATKVPSINGFEVAWSDTFDGSKGSTPSTQNWNLEEWYKDLNGDHQEYKASSKNLQLSGNGVLRIIPKKDSSAQKGWTSGRIESKYTLTPSPNAKTIVQAYIRLGRAPDSKKQGIWPAFWLLGDSHRNGGPIWPACGEIDIMEHVNGDTQGHAAIHCDKAPGGICNEKTGIASSVDLSDAGTSWHTWRAVIDRTANSWQEESVTMYLDGKQFHQVKGSRINDKQVWGTIAHNKMFFVLNVAVGGEWPQPPNESTADGPSVGMEVGYVAHYVQNGASSKPESDYSDSDDYGKSWPGTRPRPHKGAPPAEYAPDYNGSPGFDDETSSEPDFEKDIPYSDSEPNDDYDLDLDPHSPLRKPKPGPPSFDGEDSDFDLPRPGSHPGFDDEGLAPEPGFDDDLPYSDSESYNDEDSDLDYPGPESHPGFDDYGLAPEPNFDDGLPYSDSESYDDEYSEPNFDDGLPYSDSESYDDEDLDFDYPGPRPMPRPESSHPGFDDDESFSEPSFENNFPDHESYDDEDLNMGSPRPLTRPRPGYSPGFDSEDLDSDPYRPLPRPESGLNPGFDNDEPDFRFNDPEEDLDYESQDYGTPRLPDISEHSYESVKSDFGSLEADLARHEKNLPRLREYYASRLGLKSAPRPERDYASDDGESEYDNY